MTTAKKRILVVDDSQSMRAAAKTALAADYDVMYCEDGLEAVSTIAAFKPDLVFVDITMPNLDGYETVALIRLNEAFKETPILMMSSKGGVFDLARGRLLGFNGAIVKPFQAPDMRKVVEEHLGPLVVR
ncbi:response regulator [Paucibacter soli]|uniref:response regulator n=1 Tax=Paucibacter soli TaxID=3133433 RepID=UPI0030A53E15